MSYYVWSDGRDFPLFTTVRNPSTGAALTGQTPEVALRRQSDGLYWNGNVGSPGFQVSPVFVTLPEVSATDFPGLYQQDFPNAAIGNVEVYEAYYRITTGAAAGQFDVETHFSTDEIFIPTTNPAVPVAPGDTVMGRLAAMENSTGAVALANADAVWDEDNSQHLLAGSTGAALAKAALCAGGVGASMVTITVETGAAVPISGAQVDVFDASNTNFVLRAFTNVSGQLSLALDDGSYAVRLFASGFSFTVPETLTVSGATAVTYVGTGLVTITPPSAPNLCVIFGTLRDAGGNAHAGVCLEFISTVPQVVSGVQETNRLQSVVTDANGFFEIELERNAAVTVEAEAAGIEISRTVPDAPTQDFTTWT